MNFKLGIIIPTYDSLDTLKVLLGNICDYTDREYMVYIIEDGQKQETIDWLKEQKDISVIYHEKNKGVSPSWNDGLRQAQKDNCTHFAFINDDVEVPQNWWSDCRKVFEDYPIHLLSLDCSRMPLQYKFDSSHISGWFFIIDRVCVEKVGYFDEQFAPFCAEDDDYFERYKKTDLKRGMVDIKIFHHGSNTLKKLDPKAFWKVKQENWHKFRAKYPDKRMQAYDYNFSRSHQ